MDIAHSMSRAVNSLVDLSNEGLLRGFHTCGRLASQGKIIYAVYCISSQRCHGAAVTGWRVTWFATCQMMFYLLKVLPVHILSFFDTFAAFQLLCLKTCTKMSVLCNMPGSYFVIWLLIHTYTIWNKYDKKIKCCLMLISLPDVTLDILPVKSVGTKSNWLWPETYPTSD